VLRRRTVGDSYARCGGVRIDICRGLSHVGAFDCTTLSFPSNRQRLSNGKCLKDKKKDYQNCYLLYCVRQLCIMIRTQVWAVLRLNIGLL